MQEKFKTRHSLRHQFGIKIVFSVKQANTDKSSDHSLLIDDSKVAHRKGKSPTRPVPKILASA
jgi:hypothetical protein